MSQVSSQVQDSAWSAIPIAKFSHNTCPVGTRHFTWTHTLRSDLDFSLQEVRVIDGHGNERAGVVLNIAAGAEVFEAQELLELVEIHQAAADGERPVEMVVKSPFLAMRYPKGNLNIRRFQVRFRSDDDFKKAVQALSDLGLPCTDKNAPSNPVAVARSTNSTPLPIIYQSERRPSSTISPASSAGTVAMSSGTYGAPSNMAGNSSPLPTHPSMNLSSYASPQLTTLRTPFTGLGHTSHTSPLKNHFKVPERPVSAISERSFRPAPMIRPSSAAASLSMLTSSHFSGGRTESSSASQTQLPPLYLSQIRGELPRRAPLLQTSQHSDIEGGHRTYSMVENSYHGISPQSQPQDSYRQFSASPHFPLPQNTERAPMGLGFVAEDPFSDSPSPPRTLTQIYDDMIPPRRELPFKRPLSIGAVKSTTPILPPARESHNRPQISGPVKSMTPKLAPILEASPVSKPSAPKKPNPEKVAAQALPAIVTPILPPKKRVAQRKSSVKPKATEEQHVTESDQAELGSAASTASTASANSTSKDQDDTSPLAIKSAAIARPASVPASLVSKTVPPAKKRAAPANRPTSAEKRKRMVDQCTQTLPIEDRLTPVTPRAALSAIAPELVENVPSPASPPESYLNSVDNFITKYKDRPAPATPVRPIEIYESPGYAVMDDEKRQEMLNDFLCKSLHDANFLKLCEDMEHSWRRIGFM